MLKKDHQEYEVENEKIFSKVYPGKTYSHDSLKKLMSEFLVLSEKFLKEFRFAYEEFYNRRFLLNELAERRIDKQYELNFKKLINEISEGNIEINYNQRAGLENLKMQFDLKRSLHYNISNLVTTRSDYNLNFFFDHLYCDLYEAITMRLVFKDININLLSERFMKFLDLKSFMKSLNLENENEKVLYLMSNLMLMLSDPEKEIYYFNAKQILLQIYIPPNGLRDNISFYLDSLQSFCTEKKRYGNEKFRIESLELFKHKYEQMKTITDYRDSVNCIEFADVLNTSLDLDDIEWAEYFTGQKRNNKYNFELELMNT